MTALRGGTPCVRRRPCFLPFDDGVQEPGHVIGRWRFASALALPMPRSETRRRLVRAAIGVASDTGLSGKFFLRPRNFPRMTGTAPGTPLARASKEALWRLS